MTNIDVARQLFCLSPEGSASPHYVDDFGRLHTKRSENVPLITWPNHSWCHAANTFMRELYECGQSRRNRGGSLSVAAAHISHLLRFCWKRRTDLIELTDNDFREFLDQLLKEKHADDPSRAKRDANSVIAVGRSCLSFLDSVGRNAGDSGFVGEEGRIRATLRARRLKPGPLRAARTIARSRSYHHPAFPTPSPKKKRTPVSSSTIESLRGAVAENSCSSHQRMRRHCTLRLLEITGARRGEVVLLPVGSLRAANTMQHPMLLLPTLKKRTENLPERYVPISRADLLFLLQYADVHRRSVIRRLRKGEPDHGILLVSERTGLPLAPNTVTQEIHELASAAGIDQKVCPHMFRHRFITKIFVALIEQHKIENADHFRRLLLDGEELKLKVAEWTGHSSLLSLERYISLAFDEVANFQRIYDLTNVGTALDSFVGLIDIEVQAIAAGESPAMVAQRLKAYAEQIRREIASSKTPSPDSGSDYDHALPPT